MDNEEFKYETSRSIVEFSPLDKDEEICIELDYRGNCGLIYLPRSKAIELRDWLSKVLEDEK